MAGEQPKPGSGTPNPLPGEQQPKDAPKPEGGDPAAKVEGEQQPKVEQPKVEGEQPKVEGGDPAPKPKAPEKYALVVPEGTRVTADELAAVEAVARANDWTNDEAMAEVEAIDVSRKEQAERFFNETKADPTYGGDNLPITEKHANAVLDRFAPQGTPRADYVRGLLTRTGLFNNVHVLGLLADIGKAMGEDPGPGGGTGAGKATSTAKTLTTEVAAQRLYGKKKA
jgi:hypothetical protein